MMGTLKSPTKFRYNIDFSRVLCGRSDIPRAPIRSHTST